MTEYSTSASSAFGPTVGTDEIDFKPVILLGKASLTGNATNLSLDIDATGYNFLKIFVYVSGTDGISDPVGLRYNNDGGTHSNDYTFNGAFTAASTSYALLSPADTYGEVFTSLDVHLDTGSGHTILSLYKSIGLDDGVLDGTHRYVLSGGATSLTNIKVIRPNGVSTMRSGTTIEVYGYRNA